MLQRAEPAKGVIPGLGDYTSIGCTIDQLGQNSGTVMRIAGIAAYTADLEYTGKAYAFAGGRSHQVFTSTVVVLTADTGLEGYGEVCPCGPNYMPAFAEGIPACLSLLAPAVIGEDPRQISAIHERMNQTLTGQAVAKAAIDIACWDLLGKATGLPVYTLLGGLQTPSMPLHRIVPLAEPAEMQASLRQFRSEGIRHIQIKLGHDVDEDIELVATCVRVPTFVGHAEGDGHTEPCAPCELASLSSIAD